MSTVELPTAEQLRAEIVDLDSHLYGKGADRENALAELDRVRSVLGARSAELVRLSGRTLKASEERQRAALADEIHKLTTLTDEIETKIGGDPPGFERKLRFGQSRRVLRDSAGGIIPGNRAGGPDPAVAGLQRLSAEHRMLDWIEHRDEYAREFTDHDGAWNALARGLLHDDWDRWRLDYASAMRLSLSEGGEGGELVPAPLAGNVIDLMRASTPIFALGARVVPMTARTLEIARITADPTATAWHAEAGAITPDTAMALDTVTFTAKTLPVIVKVSMELAEDAPNVGEVVRQALASAIGVELTRAALRGTGASNAPTGIRSQSGVTITELGTDDGAAASYDDILDARAVLWGENTDATGYLMAPRTRNSLQKLKETSTGAYLAPPEGYTELPRFTSTVIPTNLTVGETTTTTEVYVSNWAHLLIGMRTSMRIKVLDQRYADTGEVAFMAWLRADVQLEHPESHVVITGVTN